MDSLVLKYYSTMLNRLMYKFHLNPQYYYEPMLMFATKRVDNDHIGVNVLTDYRANTIPANRRH